MATVIIPLNSDPRQTFKAKVPIGSENINLTYEISFNEVITYWVMNLLRNGEYIVSSIPLVPGDYPAGNLLGQYEYLGIGGAYLVPMSTLPPEEWPTANNLGSEWVLVWSDEG